MPWKLALLIPCTIILMGCAVGAASLAREATQDTIWSKRSIASAMVMAGFSCLAVVGIWLMAHWALS